MTDYDISISAKLMLVTWVGFAVMLLGIALAMASPGRLVLPMVVLSAGLAPLSSVVIWWGVQELRAEKESA